MRETITIELKEEEDVLYGKKHVIRINSQLPEQEVFYDDKKVASGELLPSTRYVFLAEWKGKEAYYEVIVRNQRKLHGHLGPGPGDPNPHYDGSSYDDGTEPSFWIDLLKGSDVSFKREYDALVARDGETVYDEIGWIHARPTSLKDLRNELMSKSNVTSFAYCPHCENTVRISNSNLCPNCGKQTQPIPAAPSEPALPEREVSRTVDSSPTRFCKRCGAKIPKGTSNFCWNCGTSLQEAMEGGMHHAGKDEIAPQEECAVCKMALSPADDSVYCPFCGSHAHRDHLLEWLHVNGKCPVCNHKLDEDIIRAESNKRTTGERT